MFPRPRFVLILSLTCIAVLTLLPTRGYRTHAHWDRVQWVPFGERSLPPLQAAANVALFLPLGWALARMWPRRRALAVVSAAALSGAIETVQVFAHGRYPTTTDVALNVAGAFLGVLLAMRSSESAELAAAGRRSALPHPLHQPQERVTEP